MLIRLTSTMQQMPSALAVMAVNQAAVPVSVVPSGIWERMQSTTTGQRDAVAPLHELYSFFPTDLSLSLSLSLEQCP